MTTETRNAGVHTCSYSCERPECIRAQRDELASRVTAETSNAREWDVAMALHWIDRYASGIDAECQLDRVAEALGVTLPEGYAATPPPPAAEGVQAASVPVSELEKLAKKLRRQADAAYVGYIHTMDSDTCRGWEFKVQNGSFARANLDAFTSAAERLGRHRAMHGIATELTALAQKGDARGQG